MAILTRLPLQRRIMVLVAGGLGLALLAAALVGQQVIAQSTARVLEERLVLARVQAAHLDERLASSLHRLEGLAAATSWDRAGRLSPEARRLLVASAERPGLFSGGFIVLDALGRPVWPAKAEKTIVPDPVVQTALAGNPAVSGLVRVLPEAHPAAAMLVPLRDSSGRVTGALGGIVDLRKDTLTQLVAPLALGRTGHAVIVDRDGIVLAGTEAHERFTRGDHPDFFAALIRTRTADVGRTPEIEDGVAKEQHIMAFAPLTVGHWGLGFGQSEWEVFQHERNLQRQILLLGLGLLAAGIWFGWRDAREITAPLRRLMASAQRIARADLESPIPSEPGYEVGLLAGALEGMRDSLQRMHAELQQRADVIERREREARALYEVSRAILSQADLPAVLSTIASSARSLLGSEVSAVCLWDRTDRLIPGAFDGPPEAFQRTDGAAACAQYSPDGNRQPARDCPFIRPEFREMHVTASLQAGDRLVGYMCVGCRQPRSFRHEDADLLTALASLAAIAVESAQLRDQVQQLAVMEERERIGRDLHDSIIQSLYGLSLALEHSQRLITSRSPQAVARLDAAIETLTMVIKNIRSYVLGLHPADGQESLGTALERVVREFRMNTLLPVQFRALEVPADFSSDQRLHLQLLLREALANVARHATAARVVVEAATHEGAFRLIVTDDGHGFDVEAASRGDGLGLRTMTERARRLGGRLAVRSQPGGGTTVEVRVPRTVAPQVAR